MDETEYARRCDREVGVHYWLAATEREELKREAASQGLTMQQLFELRMLAESSPESR